MRKFMKNINWTLLTKDIKNIIPVGIVLLVFLTFLYIVFGSNCIFMCVTGFPCPGCGLTRAGINFLMLQWGNSLYYNPFIFPIALLSLLGVVNRYIRNKSNSKLTKWVILMGICMILYYGYRMYVYFPTREPVVYHDHNISRIIHLFITK